MNYKMTIPEAESILFKRFNIKETTTELLSEIDFNFKIKANKKNLYILKISCPDEDEK